MKKTTDNHLWENTNFKNSFILSVLSVFVLLNLLVGLVLINWFYWLSVVQFLILEVINIGIAYNIVEISFALFVNKNRFTIPYLINLTSFPRVALLYLTCDDLVDEAFDCLDKQSYTNLKIFILDDSQLPSNKKKIDQSTFQVIRRKSRSGNKAGSLNNWIENYSYGFEYFVVLDSDSILDNDFVEKMLLFGENPDNKTVAIFQSISRIWNFDKPFSHIFFGWEPIWQFPFIRLANGLDSALSVGHNGLYRLSAIIEAGNFSTEYIAEDYATSIKLMQIGFRTRLVPILSYEAAPMTIKSFTGRNIRWAEQTIDLFRLDMHKIPSTTQLHIFMNLYSYMIWLFYLPGMILSLYGFHTTFQEFINIFPLMFTKPQSITFLLPYLVLIAIYLYFLLSRLPIAVINRVSWQGYFSSLIVFVSMTSYIIIPQVIHILSALIKNKQPKFTVTEKKETKMSLWQILTDNYGSGLFIVLLVLFGVIYNPVSILWNFPWVIPILISPIILYFAHNDSGSKKINRTHQL